MFKLEYLISKLGPNSIENPRGLGADISAFNCDIIHIVVDDMPNTIGYGYEAIIDFFEDDKCYYLYGCEDLFSILKTLDQSHISHLYFIYRKD